MKIMIPGSLVIQAVNYLDTFSEIIKSLGATIEKLNIKEKLKKSFPQKDDFSVVPPGCLRSMLRMRP
jgi:hypothetical protein